MYNQIYTEKKGKRLKKDSTIHGGQLWFPDAKEHNTTATKNRHERMSKLQLSEKRQAQEWYYYCF